MSCLLSSAPDEVDRAPDEALRAGRGRDKATRVADRDSDATLRAGRDSDKATKAAGRASDEALRVFGPTVHTDRERVPE